MLNLNYDEKIELMSTLNWDYLDKHEDMLAVIEGKLETSGAFTQDKLFVRSLERLPWHSEFETIAWTNKPSWDEFRNDIDRIVFDMMSGK